MATRKHFPMPGAPDRHSKPLSESGNLPNPEDSKFGGTCRCKFDVWLEYRQFGTFMDTSPDADLERSDDDVLPPRRVRVQH
jgi:hypothetical protein